MERLPGREHRTVNLLDESGKTILIDGADILFRLAPGRIGMEAPDLLRQQGEAFVDRLLQRTLAMETVSAVSIDRHRGLFTIEYEPAGRDLAETLTGIAGALRGDGPLTPGVEVMLDWTSIPGVVTRIDRVRKVSATPEVRGSPSTASRWGAWFRSGSGGKRRDSKEDEIVLAYRAPFRPGDGDVDGVCTCLQAPATADASSRDLARAGTECPSAPRGWKRAFNLMAAGGCFAMSIVGFIMPGVPTVPFVLGTSYFLVRSTPALNERLRRSWLFGQIVRDFEDEGGMRASVKARTLALMFAMIGGSILLAGTSAPVLGMSAVVAGIDLAIVLLLPTIPSEPRRLQFERPYRALLTA